MQFTKNFRLYSRRPAVRFAVTCAAVLVVALPMLAQSAGPMGGAADGFKSTALYIADALAICAMVYGGYKGLIEHHAGGLVTVIIAAIFMLKAQSFVTWIKSFGG